MELSLFLVWYGRNEDFSPNYEEKHHGIIKGTLPQDCMHKLEALKNNHDLSKFTNIEIVYIY